MDKKEATANLKQPLPLCLSAVEETSPQDIIFIGQMDFSVLKKGRHLNCSITFFSPFVKISRLASQKSTVWHILVE